MGRGSPEFGRILNTVADSKSLSYFFLEIDMTYLTSEYIDPLIPTIENRMY